MSTSELHTSPPIPQSLPITPLLVCLLQAGEIRRPKMIDKSPNRRGRHPSLGRAGRLGGQRSLGSERRLRERQSLGRARRLIERRLVGRARRFRGRRGAPLHQTAGRRKASDRIMRHRFHCTPTSQPNILESISTKQVPPFRLRSDTRPSLLNRGLNRQGRGQNFQKTSGSASEVQAILRPNIEPEKG